MPDLFLSAHAHSYQRYTRRVTFNGKALEIPFIVAGMGGINDQAIIDTATGNVRDDDLVKFTLHQLPAQLVDGTFTLSVPYRIAVNRKKSVFEQRTNALNGGGFAKYLVFASYSHRL